MSEVKVSSWIKDIYPFLNNPAAVQRASLMRLRDIKDGKVDVPDATSPFAWLIETSAVNTAAFLEANELSTRRQYPSVAQTLDDIYLHMSDKDYIDRFATPATTKFKILIEKRALEKALVLDPLTGVSKVTIPRNTEFVIEGIAFSIQYPIDIKKLNHGGFQVTYNTDVESPLEILTTNQVENEFITPENGNTFLLLTVPAQQFWIKTVETTITSIKAFNKNIKFDDSFYYVRIFIKTYSGGSKWHEIKTTHTDQVYDPEVPTAVLKVTANNLNVFIPQIYFSNGLASGKIRIDIYQTKGNISLNLATFNPNSFIAKWQAIDSADVTQEVANFRNISEIIIYSKDVVNGGSLELSFEELRRRVINGTTGARNLPITNVQIEDSLKSNGFNIVKNVDVVTNRTFLATRELIKPFDEKLITAAATSTQSLIFTMKEIALHPFVYNNGARITLSPKIIYKNNNGQLEVVSAQVLNDIVQDIENNKVEDAAKKINSEDYVYSPFHYCLDATEDDFKVRPYYLDNPKADIRQFIDNNDTTLLEANTELYWFTRTEFGYRLTVQVKGNENYKQIPDASIFAQLYFKPKGEVSSAFVNGTLQARTQEGGAVFSFDFITNFDLELGDNKENFIYLNNFLMANLLNNPTGAKLKQDFNLIYGTYDKISASWVAQKIDNNLGQFILPNQGYAITEESFRLEFGQYLENLWAGSRSFPSINNYEKYTVDEPDRYDEDVFEVDPVTKTIFHLDANNNVFYKILHNKGDIRYDDKGEIVYRHRAGDLVRDSNGQPKALNQIEVARQVDLMVVEGSYYFSTDISSSIYKSNFVSAIVDWITDDLERLKSQTLEETFIYFYPVTSMGNLKVIGENGISTYVKAGQSFKVRLFVKEQVMKNGDLRNNLTNSTVKIIDEELKSNLVSISNIETKLSRAYGGDVISVELSGLGYPANHQVVTLIGGGDRLSIKKKITAQTDGKLIVEEDVTVEFISHTKSYI